MTVCNSTLADADINEQPIFHGFTFHHVGLAIAAIFGLISVAISLFLMLEHALHYLKPWEQKHIIRILLMVPVYAVVSYLSFLFYQHAVYFEVLRDCYEAFAIASFFTLLCNYIAPTLHDQKDYFRTIQPKNWFWGVFGLQYCTGGENKGILRKPRSGLTWFNVIWIGVFQYCLVRVVFTIVSVIAQANDLYCEESLSPAFAHIWVTVIEALSVTVAMFCLIQFYLQLKDDLAEHQPFFKVLCIKLVIFLSFWQTLVISFLSSSHGPLQPSKTLNYQDIKVGIPAVLLCIEMAIFSVMHIFAFSWKPYSKKHISGDPVMAPGLGYSGGDLPKYQGGPLGLRALADAFNPWDIIKASARGFRWLFVGSRHRHTDSSYQKPIKVDGPTNGYAGPVYAGSGESATELAGGAAGRRDRGDTVTTDAEDDRAGLLRYSAQPGLLSASRPGDGRIYYDDSALGPVSSNGSSQQDLSFMPQHPGGEVHVPPNSADVGRGGQLDTGYHSVANAPSEVHPALREERVHGQDWNFAGGAMKDVEAGIRPGYRGG